MRFMDSPKGTTLDNRIVSLEGLVNVTSILKQILKVESALTSNFITLVVTPFLFCSLNEITGRFTGNDCLSPIPILIILPLTISIREILWLIEGTAHVNSRHVTEILNL